MLEDVLIVVFLMFLNGVFAGAEIAVLSVRRTRLGQLLESKERGASAVLWLRDQPERFLATVQIGITLVGTTAAAYGGERLAHRIGNQLSEVSWIGGHGASAGFWIVVLSISFLEIVVGELVPKSLALRSAERYSLVVGPTLRGMATVTKPAVFLLTKASNFVLRFFDDETSFTESRLSPDELQELVEEAGRVGSLDHATSVIASRALDFRDLRAMDVMVPRTRIVSLPKDASPRMVLRVITRHRFARVPVYEDTPENIVGYLAMKDVLLESLAGRPVSIAALMRPLKFIPRTARASAVLEQLRSERKPMGIVVDESGGIVGLLTVEDLVEELVGEILSEHAPEPPEVVLGEDGSAVVPGIVPIRDVARELDLDLPEPEGYTTIAGLCMHLASGVPDEGTVLTLDDGSTIEIVESDARTVRRVRIRPAT